MKHLLYRDHTVEELDFCDSKQWSVASNIANRYSQGVCEDVACTDEIILTEECYCSDANIKVAYVISCHVKISCI